MYHSNNNHAEKSLAHNPTVLHTFINGGNSWNFLWQLFLKCSGWPFTLRHGHHVRIGENPWNVFTVGRHWDYRRHFDLSTGRVGIKITGPTDEVGRPSKKEQVQKKWDGSVAQLSLSEFFFLPEDLRMRECVWDDKAGKRNWKDKRSKELTLKESEDEREERAKPPLNFYSFVRCE